MSMPVKNDKIKQKNKTKINWESPSRPKLVIENLLGLQIQGGIFRIMSHYYFWRFMRTGFEIHKIVEHKSCEHKRGLKTGYISDRSGLRLN